jgi:hypothetical protein
VIITSRQLRRLINEEMSRVILEQDDNADAQASIDELRTLWDAGVESEEAYLGHMGGMKRKENWYQPSFLEALTIRAWATQQGSSGTPDARMADIKRTIDLIEKHHSEEDEAAEAARLLQVNLDALSQWWKAHGALLRELGDAEFTRQGEIAAERWG